jgi:DivIVA domain-containing protein
MPARGYRHQRPLGQVITVTQHEHPFHYYRSPEEIREVQFSHRVRGLDEYEVAEYLDLLADQVHATNLELARLRDERDRLRLENERLRAEGHRAPVPAAASTSPEATPHAASLLLNAQKVADDLVEEAVRRARDMLTVARAEKNAILRNAKEEAAALLVEARDARSSTSRPSSGLHSSSPSSGPSSPQHSSTPLQAAPMHLAPQRTWQLDGHAAV